MAKTTERRQRRRVMPEMQDRLLRRFVLVPAAILTMLILGISMFAADVTREALSARAELPSLTWLLYAVGGLVVFTGVAMVVWVQRVTFQIAGPTYRFVEAFRRIRTGDVESRVKLRKGDHLGLLVPEVNATLEWLEERLAERLGDQPSTADVTSGEEQRSATTARATTEPADATPPH